VTPDIGYIPVDNLHLVWDTALPLLRPAVERQDDIQLSEVVDEICSGALLLWLVSYETDKPVLALTTRVIEYPNRKATAIEWVGGDHMSDVIEPVLSTIEKFAEAHGCDTLEGPGRPGWGRVLKAYGWEPKYTVYRKELGHGQQDAGNGSDVDH